MAEIGGHGEKEAHEDDNREVIQRVLHDVFVGGGEGSLRHVQHPRVWFKVPLAYLGTTIISELLRMVKDEFGFVSDGTITLPFDAAIMEYAMCLLRREAAEEVMKAFFSSVARLCSFDNGVVTPCIGLNQHLAVC